MTDSDIKLEICEVGRRIYQNGFAAANDGNISVKAEDGFWTTPTGVSKGFMTTDMLVKVDKDGKILEGNLRPSSELKLHLRVYNERPDVGAVVHAHPPFVTAHAACGIALNKQILPEATIFIGGAPLVPYGTPSTDELPDNLSRFLEQTDAYLLENHGAVTVGAGLMNAYFKMESLEYYAKISFLTRLMGGAKELTPDQVLALIAVRKAFGVPGRHPLC